MHGTSEFCMLSGDHVRMMFAFYVKADIIAGLGAGHAHVEEKGMPGPSKRKRHRGGHSRAAV